MERADAVMRDIIEMMFLEISASLVMGNIVPLVTASVFEAKDPIDLSPAISAPELDEALTRQIDARMMPITERAYHSGAIDAIIHLPVADAAYGNDPAAHVLSRVLNPLSEEHLANSQRAYARVSAGVSAKIQATLQEGFSKGEGAVKLANRVRMAGVDSLAQATAIARTQVVQASNAGSMAQARIFGNYVPVVKEWLNTKDRRTRLSHIRAGGQEVPLDDKFNLGGHRLDFPGDPTGPASEVINCRCTVLFNEPPLDQVLPPTEPRLASPIPDVSDLEPLDVEMADVDALLRNYADSVFQPSRLDSFTLRQLNIDSPEQLADAMRAGESLEDLLARGGFTPADAPIMVRNLAHGITIEGERLRNLNILHPDIREFFSDLWNRQRNGPLSLQVGDWPGFERWLIDQIGDGELNVNTLRGGARYFGFQIDDDVVTDLWTKQLRMVGGHSRDLVPDREDLAAGFRRFNTWEEEDEWYDRFFGDSYLDDMTATQRRGLKTFISNGTGKGSGWVNDMLRFGWSDDQFNAEIEAFGGRAAKLTASAKDARKTAQIMQTIEDLPSSVLPEDTMLYRGVGRVHGGNNGSEELFNAIDAYRERHGSLVGMEFSDKGYQSTSLNPDWSLQVFSQNRDATFDQTPSEQTGSALLLQIRGQTGDRAMPIWRAGGNREEREILLPKCSTFKVLSEDVVGVSGRYVTRLTVELIQGTCPP